MQSTVQLLRISEVSKRTTLAKSTIWLKMSQGHFPKCAKLSPGINVWTESSINEWIKSHFPTLDQGEAA